MNIVDSLNKNKSIVGFLILEMLALVSFNFGNLNDLLNFAGVLIGIAGFVFVFATSDNKKEFLKILPVVVILFIVSGLAAFGGFSSGFKTFSNIAVFLSLPSFFVLGFCARRIKEIKVEHILLAVGFGFALLVLFNMFSTWIEYGLFYSIIYKIKGVTNYYYNGITYDVTKEMYFLNGFHFNEISIEYGGLFSLICAAYLPALIFINPKEHRNDFIAVAVIGGIGFISLLTVPNFTALIILVIGAVFAFAYKYLAKKEKVFNILGFVTGGLIALTIVFYILALLNAAIGFKFPGILNRIFVENGIMKGPSSVLEAAFIKDGGTYINLFGLNLNNITYNTAFQLTNIAFENTGIFEVQIIKEVGPIGALLFVLFLTGMVYFLGRYIKKGSDTKVIKTIITIMLFVFFAYSSIANEILPFTHIESIYIAFLRSGPLMIMLFMFGLIYFAPEAKEEDKDEK